MAPKPSPDERTEQIAVAQHEIWIQQMRFFLSCGTARADGSILLDPAKVQLWQQQMNMPYSQLSTAQKQALIDHAAQVIAALSKES